MIFKFLSIICFISLIFGEESKLIKKVEKDLIEDSEKLSEKGLEEKMATLQTGLADKDSILLPGYPAAGRITLKKTPSYYSSASFLYMRMKSDEEPYALTSKNPVFIINSRSQEPNIKFHPGFEVCLGVNLTHDNWSLFTNFTRITTNNKDSCLPPVGGSIIPLIFSSLDLVGIYCDKANTDAKIEYNLLSLCMSRPFYDGRYLILKPFFGAIGHLVHGHVLSNYYNVTGEYYSAGGSVEFELDWAKKTVHYTNYGLGPKVGMNYEWILCRNIKIIGEESLSVFYTRTKGIVKERVSDITQFFEGSDDILFSVTVKKNNLTRINIKTLIGLGWGNYFNQGRNFVDLNLGYEFHYWILDTYKMAPLWLNGLFFKLKFDF